MARKRTELLLARTPLALDPLPEGAFDGQTLLVTGAGGSIGSALCRGLAALGVRRLILLDHAEGNLDRIEQEMAARVARERVEIVLGDVGDGPLLEQILARHRPELVFHTAAFKHVPLLEGQPAAAVRNNVLSTHALARAADRWGVRRLVLLSTDKAVKPTSLMGATKRMAELVLLAEGTGETRYTCLRLGNVLGSSGSVLRRFRRQLRRRQALTVTHADATRYFVTSREAVGLLLHSACIGGGGDLLVPDLGPPVNILQLARRFRGAEDVPIVFTGLRPGEKLEEELWTEAEQLRPTAVRGLFRLEGPRPSRLDVERWVRELGEIVHRREDSSLVAKVREIVPEYRPDASTMDAVRRQGLAR